MCWLIVVLLLIPQIGNAECSWVLWTKRSHLAMYEGEGEGVWRVERALKTTEECQSILAKYVKIKSDTPKHPSVKRDVVIGNTNGVIIVSGNDKQGVPWSFTDHFLCLPDTVDPRAPKR